MTQTHHISWKTSHKRQIETLSDGFSDFLPPSVPLRGREGDGTSACFKGFVPFFFIYFVLTCNPSFQVGFDAPAMSQIHLNTLIAHYGETPFKPSLKNQSSTSSWLYFFFFHFSRFFLSLAAARPHLLSTTAQQGQKHGCSIGAWAGNHRPGPRRRWTCVPPPPSSYRSSRKILVPAKSKLSQRGVVKTEALEEVLCPERREK